MTIAFVLQTHKSLGQISRLVDALDRGLSEKLIVVSHNGPLSECERIAEHPGVARVIPAPGGRAHFLILDGLFSAFRWLEHSSSAYDWSIVLSGQDYPIRPLHELQAELDSSTFDGHFWHFDVERPPPTGPETVSWTRAEAETRYYFQSTRLRRQLSTMDRALWKLPRHLLDRTSKYRLHTGFGLHFSRRADLTPFGPNLRLYGGSNWLTIRRKCVQRILAFVDERPDVTNYFRATIAPDESFPHTVLANDRSLKLSTKGIHYYNFANSRYNSPATLTRDNIASALASGCYFARKFDIEIDAGVLDHLDATFHKPRRAINPVIS